MREHPSACLKTFSISGSFRTVFCITLKGFLWSSPGTEQIKKKEGVALPPFDYPEFFLYALHRRKELVKCYDMIADTVSTSACCNRHVVSDPVKVVECSRNRKSVKGNTCGCELEFANDHIVSRVV